MSTDTSAFRNQSWTNRLGTMGDPAEAAFEEWATESKRGFARYGLNRPPIHVHKLPLLIRYTPDYLMTPYLVEVMGFGRDQVCKLKVEKWDALDEWATHHPVRLFLWDSHNERRFMVDPRDLMGVGLVTKQFPEGKSYFELPAELLADVGEVL